MLRILQPGLLCRAPPVLASQAIGTQALKARGSVAQGVSPGYVREADISPARAVQAVSPLQGLNVMHAGTPGLRLLRILRPGLLCRAPPVLPAPAIGGMQRERRLIRIKRCAALRTWESVDKGRGLTAQD